MPKVVVIAGGGPAGLTAAHELLQHKDYLPIVFEKENQLGGISKTIQHSGNRMDLGGHRFFSKSDWVMDWWLKLMPLETGKVEGPLEIAYQRSRRKVTTPAKVDASSNDLVMLVRERKSRILFGGKFFDYPLTLSPTTVRNLGLWRCIKFGFSYVAARFSFAKEGSDLESFFIRRFGKELYRTFFQSYTEKVWGKRCSEISAAWGAQRVKGLSITKALIDAAKRLLGVRSAKVETSLIEKFFYPKYGPGQLWEEVGRRIEQAGVAIHMRHQVTGVRCEGGRIRGVTVRNLETGETSQMDCDYLVSTMPIPELLHAFESGVPKEVMEVADTLQFRDFVTMGVLVEKLGPKFADVKDTWLYVQDASLRVGRIQFFNQWSPHLVADPTKVWVGLEYFCQEGDDLSRLSDAEWLKLVSAEVEAMGLALAKDILDTKLVRVSKAYPAYWGGFDRMGVIREFTDSIQGLFLVGRNGMHRYNNQDHSMLTAAMASRFIVEGIENKDPIWQVNTEQDYHETKVETPAETPMDASADVPLPSLSEV